MLRAISLRYRNRRAASDNVTHGSWIITAGALCFLLVGLIGVPGSPARHWLHRVISHIPEMVTATPPLIVNSGLPHGYTMMTSDFESLPAVYQGVPVTKLQPESATSAITLFALPSGILQPDSTGNYQVTLTFKAAASTAQTYIFRNQPMSIVTGYIPNSRTTATGPNPVLANTADAVDLTPTLTSYSLHYTISGATPPSSLTSYWWEIYLSSSTSSGSVAAAKGPLYLTPMQITATPS